MSTGSGRHRKTIFTTPFGRGLLVWREDMLISLSLPERRAPARGAASPQGGLEKRLVGRLESYFAGAKVEFDALSLPLERTGWSRFDTAVAHALAGVPYGEVRTYGELAAAAGHPLAHRAAGNFLAKNPFPVILPCHRIVRRDGRPGGFAAGAGWKRRLLALESAPVIL